MSLREPIVRQSPYDELLQRVRELIGGGMLEPGEKVPERALCEWYGVSRPLLRETLVWRADG